MKITKEQVLEAPKGCVITCEVIAAPRDLFNSGLSK